MLKSQLFNPPAINNSNRHILLFSAIFRYRKKVLLILAAVIVIFTGCHSAVPWISDDISITEDDLPPVEREFRAVWIATVANIDWPSERGLPAEKQQEELIRILDRVTALNFNAVIFQVRPAADAIYESPYEPWASYLSGKMGMPPEPYYDPLEFAIREAHKRGLAFHAWFNPFRAGHAADHSEISEDHISRTSPELVHQYGNFMWLDPGKPEAREHSRKVILDVVKRYDIDGVHFDDYFYPYRSYADGTDFPDDESWQQAVEEGVLLSRDDWRRRNVNLFIEQVSQDIKELKPQVKFGISPFGIWQPGYPRRTTGFNAHNELFADARLWLREGWVDYFTPQIYYRTDQVAQPYPVMLQWWVEQNKQNRHLWPGIYTSRIVTANPTWPAGEIINQLYISRGFPGVTGSVHFSMQALMRSPDRFRELLSAGPYAEQALLPTSPWVGGRTPGIPTVHLQDDEELTVHIEPNGDEPVRNWLIRSRTAGNWEHDIIPGDQRSFTLSRGIDGQRPDIITVSAVDRLGNTGASARVSIRDRNREPKTDNNPFHLSNLISRSGWAADPPGGYPANSIRRNLSSGDTLKFRDLSVVIDDVIPTPPLIDPEGVEPYPALPPDLQIPDSVKIKLHRNGAMESYRIAGGEAFNWYGYHIGVLQVIPRLPGSGTVQIELATVHSLPVNRAASMQTGDASQRMRVPHKINRITLHHTGGSNPLSIKEDASERVRALQNWSNQQNWWDLPYHFLIDLEGNIFEGRDPAFAGETNGLYDPRGHLKIGAIGNYNLQAPTENQILAIAELIVWASKKYNIPDGEIYGHDDWANTSGPGIHLRKILDDGSLARTVETLLYKEAVSEENNPVLPSLN